MGEAEIAFLNGFTVTLKTVQKKAYSVAASSYRRMHVKDVRPKRSQAMANKLSSENSAQPDDGRELTRADNNPPSLVGLLIEQITETYALEFAKGRADPRQGERYRSEDRNRRAARGVDRHLQRRPRAVQAARRASKNETAR